MSFTNQKTAIVEICRRMHERCLISGGQGNVSVRLDDERLLITPSGVNKGFLSASDLIVADMTGEPSDTTRRVSSEIKVHLAAYRARPDCRAVVHGHPAASVALTLAGIPLDPVYLPETAIALGKIPTGRYETPSSTELADGVESLAVDHDVIMMARHGAVCLGKDVFSAYDRLESLEHNSRIIMMARLLGKPEPLPEDEVARLMAMAAEMDY